MQTYQHQFLTEKVEDIQVLTEEVGGKKNYFIEGIFMQSNIKNRNGRMYPDEIMGKEVNRYIKESVEKNRAYGELTHPNHPNIDLAKVSHLIKSIRKEGNNYIGKAQVLDTPNGNVVRGILEAGGAIGASSRAVGTLKADKSSGAMIVQDDFRLATAADIVSDPSAPDAWVNAIVENKEWVQVGGGLWVEQTIEGIRSDLHNLPKANLKEGIDKLWTRYQTAISK
jgi:hypothetical protein